MRQKDGSLVYCEHNRIGIKCYGLMGKFDVYTCALNLRGGRPLLAGWYKECEYICPSAPKGTKYISWTVMQKNEERLKYEQKEKEKELEEIRILRANAKSDLILADEMEKKIKERNGK